VRTLLYKTFFIAIFILCIVAIPHYTRALDDSIIASDISVDISPSNPQPYSDVTISLSSYAVDINKATIVWKNGKNTLLSGIGKASYSFKTLGPDVGITFNIAITPVESGSPLGKQVTIRPSEVTLLWESVNGYVPPFYRGKSFPSSESIIKVVAVPNSASLGSSKGKVVYTWKKNDSTDLGLSGYNKDSYVYQNNNLDTEDKVTVQASSVDGIYNATNSTTIGIVDPTIIFYKKSPTEGVLYGQALGGETSVSEDQATIVAEPYFLAIKGNESDLIYKWQTNGNDIDTPREKTELSVEPTSRGGYATIGIAIENASLLFQKVSAQLKLNL
jgi:hypothetical protein